MLPSECRAITPFPPLSPEARRELRRAVLIVTLVAGAIRLACLAGLPLIVTNDGVGYLSWAQAMLHGQPIDWPVFRTPGYPLFLAAVFSASGVGPVGVLAAQHALGVLTCAIVAAGAGRAVGGTGGKWGALICGLLAAIDPRLLAFESYALTETLSSFLFVLVIAALVGRSRSVWVGAMIGVALACLCLVRPAFQITVPFVLASFLCRLPWRPASLVPAVVLVVALGAPLAPWLLHNASRGLPGLSGAGETYFWIGANQAGLLDPEHALPMELREPYDRLVRPAPSNDHAMHLFLVESDGWRDPRVRRTLWDWTWASARADPARYAGALWHAALWQLDVFPKSGAVTHNETEWLVRRLGRDRGTLRGNGERAGAPAGENEPNFQFNDPTRDLAAFAMRGRPGPIAGLFGDSRSWHLSGAVTVLLFLSAVGAGVGSLWRRDWGTALAIAATGAYYAVHVVALLYNSRYSMPAWAAWYLMPAVLVGMVAHGRHSRLTAGLPGNQG